MFYNRQANTGTRITYNGVTYICTKRGVMTSSTECTIGCAPVTTFLSTGSNVNDRCFTNCYYEYLNN